MSNPVKKAVTVLLIIAFLLAVVATPSSDGQYKSGSAGAFTCMPDSAFGMFALLQSNSRMVDIAVASLILAVMLIGFDGIKCVIISMYSRCGEIGIATLESLLLRRCMLQI